MTLASVAALSAGGTHAVAQSSAIPFAQASTGVTNLDVVLVIDQSGSMWARNDVQATNPNGSIKTPSSRMIAANILAEWLANDQSGARHRLSVVMFGTTAKVVFPLQEIQSAEAQASFMKALADGNRDMGATNIPEAIRLAKGELDKGRTGPNDRKALIFLSDGVCEPVDPTTDAQRQQCEQDIRQFVQQEFGPGKSGSIFTIALTSDAFKQDPANQIFKNLWQEISLTTGGDYYEPAEAGAALLDSFVKVLQQLFDLPIQSPPPAVNAPTVITTTLSNDLAQVGFTLIKYGQGITMTLTSPDGMVIDPGSANIRHSISDWIESYNISKPQGGQWVARVGGNGKVILLTVPFAQTRFTIDRVQPASAHPQGKPMEIEARVLNIERAPQAVDSIEVAVQSPGGTTTTLPMRVDGTTYKALLPNTDELGTYALRFSGQITQDAISGQQLVRVVPAPWVKNIEPQPGNVYTASQPIPVRVQLMLNTAAFESPAPGDQLETAVRLLSADGQVADMQLMHPAGGGIYSGTVMAGAPGSYFIRTQLSYIPASGERFEDSAQSAVLVNALAAAVPLPTVTIQPSPQPTAAPTGAQQVAITNDFNPIYLALAGLGGIILISQLLLAGMLRSMRQSIQQAKTQQDAVSYNRSGFDAELQNHAVHGWQNVAAQLVADALKQNIAIDTKAGIIDATRTPCPRYILSTTDGREVICTTDIGTLRKMKLIRRRDRVIDISAISPTRHADAGMLWRYAMAERSQTNVAIPSSAHWYIVVREPFARTAGMRAVTQRRNLLQRLFKPRGAH